MDTLHLLSTAVTVIFIAATMFAAGLGTTLSALRGTVADLPLLMLALVANMVVIPLLGWGISALFSLSTAPFIALVLIASSPGGPFGAKLAMVQKGDLVAGAAMQVLLASSGSITFGPTANAILTGAKVGGGIHSTLAHWCEPWPSCSSCPSP
jgi:BASS family bile acid:Na+ symporter